MRRKELVQEFNVKGTFLNQLLDRADMLSEFKVGTGFASEYDAKTTFFILLGWELHQLGVSFRHINDMLNGFGSMTLNSMEKEFGQGGVAIYPKERKHLFRGISSKTAGPFKISFSSDKNLWNGWLHDRGNSNTQHLGSGVIFIDTSFLWRRIG
jgi:hypothetical protein